METPSVYNVSPAEISGNQDSIRELVDLARQGQQQAFSELYSLFFKKIFKFIFYRVSHKEIAEDLTEDVFVKAYGKIKSIDNNGSFEAWLYQIARNRVIDYYRQKKINVALDEVENILEYESNVVDAVQLQQQQQAILDLMKDLTKEQQLILKLKFFDDLENCEIAALTGRSEGSIRVIQYRALAKLTELLAQSGKNLN